MCVTLGSSKICTRTIVQYFRLTSNNKIKKTESLSVNFVGHGTINSYAVFSSSLLLLFLVLLLLYVLSCNQHE